MPDTTIRPTPLIPDIMGWEPTPEEWGYIGAFNHPDGGYVITDDRQVTPDDMLAWLAAQGFLASIIHWRHGFDVVVRKDYGNVCYDTHAPTLHAALEQAVITVGRAG